jgi:hypothetical protein
MIATLPNIFCISGVWEGICSPNRTIPTHYATFFAITEFMNGTFRTIFVFNPSLDESNMHSIPSTGAQKIFFGPN